MKFMLLLLCLSPGLASADSLYRCVSQAGHVSYQSASCPKGQRTDRTIEFVADPVLPTVMSSVPTSTSKRSATKAFVRSRQTARSMKPKPSPCARAKAKREAQLQRLGFKRTYDDLSRIDAAVREVCRGY